MCSKLNAHGIQKKVDKMWALCVSAMMEMVRSGHGGLNQCRWGLHSFYRFSVKYFVRDTVSRCSCMGAAMLALPLLTSHTSYSPASSGNQQPATLPCPSAK